MATTPLHEMFSKVNLVIDISTFEESTKVTHLLNKRSLKTKQLTGMCYEVQGSFEELEQLVYEISALKQSHKSQRLPGQEMSVEVSGSVMTYIKLKCSKELNKIGGNAVALQVRQDSGRVCVDFELTKSGHNEVQCHHARERFITFYQKMATNLQRKVFDVQPTLLQQRKYIEAKFPKLLIEDCPPQQHQNSGIMVTGSYTDIRWFKEFLEDFTERSQRLTRPEGRPPQGRYSPLPSYSAEEAEQKAEGQSCPICLDVMKKTEMRTLAHCQHSFCEGCLKKAFNSKPICPVCGVVYGQLQGTQPQNGTMDISTLKAPLPGYSKHGSIIIRYNIPSGIQGAEHPSPGHSYEGISRVAFLPDTLEGRKVAKLLKRAFEQRLIFTIGRSSTTGRNNVVTWNDIHHKTSREGGPTMYGYPDPGYLQRVQEELKAKGIY